MDGSICIERINPPVLAAGGTDDDFHAGTERAVALGWLWLLHECGTFVRFTDSGAALVARRVLSLSFSTARGEGLELMTRAARRYGITAFSCA